jgi:hypothetical protein
MASDKTPPLLGIHTPSSSHALVHSGVIVYLSSVCIHVRLIHSPVTTEYLRPLFDKFSRKKITEFYRKPVGPGWLKYVVQIQFGIWTTVRFSVYSSR